jgi:hypothetical protein
MAKNPPPLDSAQLARLTDEQYDKYKSAHELDFDGKRSWMGGYSERAFEEKFRAAELYEELADEIQDDTETVRILLLNAAWSNDWASRYMHAFDGKANNEKIFEARMRSARQFERVGLPGSASFSYLRAAQAKKHLGDLETAVELYHKAEQLCEQSSDVDDQKPKPTKFTEMAFLLGLLGKNEKR